MNTNYLGSLNIIKVVAPYMVEQKSGGILCVASAAAVTSFIGYASYSPSKYALRGLCDAIRNELSGFGI
jgi:short-subunit dehydrogenase